MTLDYMDVNDAIIIPYQTKTRTTKLRIASTTPTFANISTVFVQTAKFQYIEKYLS
jgi:hypothetical protein